MTHSGRVYRFLGLFVAAGLFCLFPSFGYSQDDWFERMAVPMASGENFVAVRDGSLKGVGLYPMTELMQGPWYVIGPFERNGSTSVPLRNQDVSSTISTLNGAATWRTVEGWDDPNQPLDLLPLCDKKENVSLYLYRSIQSPGRASVELSASADDDFTVWMNGSEVIGRTEDGGGVAPGKHRAQYALQPGENELLIRVGQASGAWRLFFTMQSWIDPRIEAKILFEALRMYPDAVESHASRVDLAQLFVELNLPERALEQANKVLASAEASAAERDRARSIIDQLVEIQLETAQAWNLYTRDDLTSDAIPIKLVLSNHSSAELAGQVELRVHDVWEREAGSIPAITYKLAPGQAMTQSIPFRPPGWGAYRFKAETRFGDVPIGLEVVVGYLPKAHDGLRPESFFAVTTESDEDVGPTAKIGVKVVRGRFCNPQWVLKSVPEKSGDPFELDFSRLDKAVELRRQQGLSILPIVGYVGEDLLKSSLARSEKTDGPPRDYREYTNITSKIVEHLKDVKYWDFWGDPEIYGPTWSASAASFRYFYKMWARAAKEVRPDVKVLTGGHPAFYVDNISHDPNIVKMLDGLTNATYFDADAPTWRSGAQRRSMDYAVRQAKLAGSGLAFVTGGATEQSANQPGLGEAHRRDAAKLVKFYVEAALCGNYQANVDEGRGWGKDYPAGNVAYAVMTHLLEDRPVVADIWPSLPLITGAVFASPEAATDDVAALPRSETLRARWKAPVPDDRKGDKTKVAVVWCATGPNGRNLDEKGSLTIQPVGDMRALDMMGREVGKKEGESLSVPFTPYPVYLLSDALSVAEMRRRIADATIEGVTPVNSYAYSLPAPLGEKPTTLTIRVQSQMNRPINGKIALSGPADWKIEPGSCPISLKPAELAELDFHVTAATTSPLNQYVLRTSIETDAGNCEDRQAVSVACIRRKTVMVDGIVDEWPEAGFTRMDIDQQEDPDRFLDWLADPSQPRSPSTGRAQVGVKLAAAYDDDFFYLAVVVFEPGLGNDTGGVADSHGQNPLTNGDCLELAFGFGDRAVDDYRKPGDSWYWNGMFRDVDYSVIQFRQRADQPILQSLYVPGLMWRTDFQTERVNTFSVPRAQTRFVRNEPERLTTYEIAIRRAYLSRFDPSQPYFRFGYVYLNDEKLPPLEWSRACGVFDYWANFGSFLPAWKAFLPCQTRWGIAR